MGRLSNISGKEAIKIFEKFGYILDQQTGTHMTGLFHSHLARLRINSESNSESRLKTTEKRL